MTEPMLMAFVAASLVVLIIPGPGVVYVIARSLSQGYRAGLASVLGLSLGALVHVFGAVVGLSAILLTSATAFTAVKLIGAAYLIYLGLRVILSKPTASTVDRIEAVYHRRLLLDGIVVSIFNPKIAVFFLAFLPQFIDQTSGNVTGQFTMLGLIYVGLALLTDGTYCLLAGSLRHWVKDGVANKFSQSALPRYLTGGLYLSLGIGAMFSGRKA